MSPENRIKKNPSLGRCPVRAVEIEGVELVKLSRDVQKSLGCRVTEDVFLDCPYAFLPRQALVELSQEPDSPIEQLSGKLLAYEVAQILVGYASEKIDAEPGDFIICLTKESTEALVSRNRSITKELHRVIHDQVRRSAKPWLDQGSTTELEQFSLRSSRALFEIEMTLPLRELVRPKQLSDRADGDVRDGYVELVSRFEEFRNIGIMCISQAAQTTLIGKDGIAQTYPGNPKNQSSQYVFDVPQEFLDVWCVTKGDEEGENNKEIGREENASQAEEEPEKTEEELALEEKKRREWEKLDNFLKSCIDEMINAVSLNATINSYTNDVVNLGENGGPSVTAHSCQDYEEIVSLIDLKTIGERYIFSVSWHCELDDIIICAHLDNDVETNSLIALWSLITPLQPKMILNCEEKISTLSFCPIANYCDIAIGGCLDGQIVVWEVNRDSLLQIKEGKIEQKDAFLTGSHNQVPPTGEAKIALSSDKSQKLSITSIQWLPTWCYIGTDGNFQKVSPNSIKEPKPYFATSSTDGSIFFWSLPRTLATPAKIRSPLHLTIAPIYQLRFEDKANKCVAVTCFCLPLAKTEDKSSLNIRDKSDLERLRKVFVGTGSGEVVCCTWEGQTFSVDVVDHEVCRIQTRCQVHDGAVQTMAKSPHLDDMFLTVGGRVFAVWKEDFAQAPLFYRRSRECRYGSGCWSGRSGMIVLTRLDGCFEVWDLKRKAHEPVLLQTVSDKVISYVYPSPPTSESKLLAIVEGTFNLRVFVEPNENRKDEDLERLEWFEEFAWHETKRKLDFHRWQEEYLRQNPIALRRKTEREQAEAKRRHQEAREKFLKEQEILAREEKERRLAQRRVSKTVIWRRKELRRAEDILLRKKGFIPAELEEKRRPLVELQEERKLRSEKIKDELGRADETMAKILAKEIPELRLDEDKKEIIEVQCLKLPEDTSREYKRDFDEAKREISDRLKRQPFVPRFNWKEAMTAGFERMLLASASEDQTK